MWDAEQWQQHGKTMMEAMLRARVRAMRHTFPINTDPAQVSVVRVIVTRMTQLWEDEAVLAMVTPMSAAGLHLLFFDGGPRGNPEPGGAGSILVSLQATGQPAEMVWCSSISYKIKRTTSNVAEYWGLIHGHRYALRMRLSHLHVVGDSTLILNKVRRYLKALHVQTRWLATQVGVESWTRHLRAHNKMVDAAHNKMAEAAANGR